MDVIRKSYGFTIDCDGQILGLIAGDMGYEATGMFVDATTTEMILGATKPDISELNKPTLTEADKLLKIALGVLNQFSDNNDSTRAIKSDIERYLNDRTEEQPTPFVSRD